MDTRTIAKITLTVAVGVSMTAVALGYSPATSPDGASYSGAANLPIGADFIQAGGGAGSFSMVRAWDNTIGPSALEGALTELTGRYGQAATDRFVRIFNFAIADAWQHAGMDNISMPEPTASSGRDLALAVLSAAKAPDGSYWTGYLLGHVLSPAVYAQVTADINDRYGPDADAQFRRVSNAFLSLVSQQIENAPVD
jgi:hypothetical protein